MRELSLIFAFLLCNLLFANNSGEEFIQPSSNDIYSMDTSEIDQKLKDFLYRFYQKNYSGQENYKSVRSMQLFGSYSLNEKKIGTVKLIKKRPNKYKSHIKNIDGSEEIIIFDGKSLHKSKKTDAESPTVWQTLETHASENLWIHYAGLFDSVMLNPEDPNKKIFLGKAFIEDGKVIQPVTIELKNEIKITNFVTIRDHLIKRALIEFNNLENADYNKFTVYYDDYKALDGILYPEKITTKLSDVDTVVTNFYDLKFNLGVSEFFFRTTPFN